MRFATSVSFLLAFAAARPNMQQLYKRHDAQAARAYHLLGQGAPISELFLDVPVDHFTTNNTNSPTYKMRYLIDDSQVQKDAESPPILFYCGNEGDIWTFYNNSGFMTKNLSAELNGLVLLGEHRFYGESLPFGDQSFSSKDTTRFLTVDQTLMDFVFLIKSIKDSNPLYTYSPVFAFGGSYGGMLAAWFRMKYPHII